MKKFFQLVVVMAVMALMSSPAWSFNTLDHVSQAPNGKGDVLVFPFYLADQGGFQTKIQVINTREDVSAVAKVVVRSPLYSQEVLDFFIFLSPRDKWEGTLQYKDNATIMYSEDDSTLTSDIPSFASKGQPFEVPLQNPGCGDVNFFGYAEVFLAYVFDDDAVWDGDPLNLTVPAVPKRNIYRAYVGEGSLFDDPQPLAGAVPGDINAKSYRNILAGNQQFQNQVLGLTTALNAVAFKDYQSERVMTVVEETVFGLGARNNLLEVEAALSKNDIALPYVHNADNTLFLFTFPTKLTELDEDCEIDNIRGEYDGFDKVRFTAKAFDMKENTIVDERPIVSPAPEEDITRFPWEVNFAQPTAFDQGWYRYLLDDGPTTGINRAEEVIEYTGAPVIPVVLNYGASGFSMMYAAYTDGAVTGPERNLVGAAADRQNGDILLEGYQYVHSYAVTDQ